MCVCVCMRVNEWMIIDFDTFASNQLMKLSGLEKDLKRMLFNDNHLSL